jgi:hypothetical protein
MLFSRTLDSQWPDLRSNVEKTQVKDSAYRTVMTMAMNAIGRIQYVRYESANRKSGTEFMPDIFY